ncbi:MAG: hypothetical protein MUF18_01210 [Fimbriiglobus sp.]|nr:hypothetical protein [Fimbriiglobus sp.]
MNPREAVLLSPYRPPTSYPVSLNPSEAEAWLNGYFALWHPAVLGIIGRPPQAASTYDHDVPKPGFLYTVPEGPTVYQPDHWGVMVADGGGASFAASADVLETRDTLRVALIDWSDRNPGERILPHLLDAPRDVVGLFEAVGFGYLLVESLFDAASHDHLLDAEGFWADVSAAVAAVPDAAAVREKLTPAVEKLANARQVLNTNSVQLVDFAIPTADTLARPWPATVRRGLPAAIIATGELLETLANEHPERFAELKEKASGETPTVDLCVGVYTEREDGLLPAESQWWNLTAARKCVQELFGVAPTVYARTRSAFHPHLPGWLLHTGFTHAVMVAFDGAMTPARNAVVVNWASPDGKAVNAFAREPLAAADPLTFFNLVYHIHQAFSTDSTPTVALKHTGPAAAVGYAQLVTLATLGDACGKWVSVAELLRDHHYGEYLGSPSADDYFNDYLDDAVTHRKDPHPVSGFAVHTRLRRKLDSAFALAGLHRMLTPPGEKDVGLLRELEAAERHVEVNREPTANGLDALEQSFAQLLADRIQVKSPPNQPGVLVFNPCNFTRRVALELSDFGGPIPVEGPVKAVEFANGLARLVVEVPSLGYTWIPRGNASHPPPKPRIKTAENGTVRNEFVEADFDPATGSLRAVRDLRTRTNRLGMQLVFNPGSRTKCRGVTVTNSGTAMGEVVCEGDITDEHNTVLCRFRQRLRAWIGRPVVELKIDLDPVHPPTGYPWHAYYAARFAWRDPRAVLFRGTHGSNDRSTYTRPVSADYLELRIGAERTFLFTGGLPYIQKHGDRMADVVLIPEGEQARSFELIVAMDREYPMPTAAGWVAPSPVVFTSKGPPHIGPTAWLAHVDLPSVLMTSLRPVPAGDGMSRAVAMRLMETAGFAGSTEVKFARDPDRVSHSSGDDVPGAEIPLNAGGATLDFSANETFRVRAEWV